MDLKKLYDQVAEAISLLDFERIWPGFAPLRFALYDDEACCFDGAYIEKTGDFCANTSILYKGEQIAIWKVEGAPGLSVLAAKIVHEMFHGYQAQQAWNCWANEMEALYRYRYDAGNLSLKLRENELLVSLLDRFDDAACQELLALRRLRSKRHPYEYSYESKVEEIEGTATYVELQVLRQLDARAAAAMQARMCAAVTKPEALFPVRISCYDTGALMIHALTCAGLYSFQIAERPAACAALKNVRPSDGNFPGKDALLQRASNAVDAFHRDTEAIIRAALAQNEVVAEGPLELACVNLYDARCYRGYTTSRYFLQYRDAEGEKTRFGNFVLRMEDERNILRVYRWDGRQPRESGS